MYILGFPHESIVMIFKGAVEDKPNIGDPQCNDSAFKDYCMVTFHVFIGNNLCCRNRGQ